MLYTTHSLSSALLHRNLAPDSSSLLPLPASFQAVSLLLLLFLGLKSQSLQMTSKFRWKKKILIILGLIWTVYMLKCSVKRLENHVLGLLGCVEEKMFSKSTRSERDPSNVKILSFTGKRNKFTVSYSVANIQVHCNKVICQPGQLYGSFT